MSRPAWSLPAASTDSIGLPAVWPEQPSREWAFGGSTGKGVRVCILDSGVDGQHPLVAPLVSAWRPEDLGLVLLAQPPTLPEELGRFPHGVFYTVNSAAV